MKVHYYLSIFTADGRAYGKADAAAESINLPAVGDRLQLDRQLSDIELVVTGVEQRAGYFGIELADLVLPTRTEAQSLCKQLEALGFDYDVWEE